MAFWNRWPYTNFHELNLDWILRIIKPWTKVSVSGYPADKPSVELRQTDDSTEFVFALPQGPQGPKGDKGDTGANGIMVYTGAVIQTTPNTETAFPNLPPYNYVVGDLYITVAPVASSVLGQTCICTKAGDNRTALWLFNGNIAGPRGPQGFVGPKGLSIYAGDAISGQVDVPTAFPNLPFQQYIVGDLYVNNSAEQNSMGMLYICTQAGENTRSLWMSHGQISQAANIQQIETDISNIKTEMGTIFHGDNALGAKVIINPSTISMSGIYYISNVPGIMPTNDNYYILAMANGDTAAVNWVLVAWPESSYHYYKVSTADLSSITSDSWIRFTIGYANNLTTTSSAVGLAAAQGPVIKTLIDHCVSGTFDTKTSIINTLAELIAAPSGFYQLSTFSGIPTATYWCAKLAGATTTADGYLALGTGSVYLGSRINSASAITWTQLANAAQTPVRFIANTTVGNTAGLAFTSISGTGGATISTADNMIINLPNGLYLIQIMSAVVYSAGESNLFQTVPDNSPIYLDSSSLTASNVCTITDGTLQIMHTGTANRIHRVYATKIT